MGGEGGILSPITNLLFGKPKVPDMPTPQAPAPPAPSRKVDTGAKIQLGTGSTIKDERVSGRRTGGTTTKARSVIGGLGAGSGIRI